MTSKTELRAAMRHLRRRLAVEAPGAAEQASANLPFFPNVHVYAVYHAVGSELDPTPIRMAGQRALPVIADRARPMVFRCHRLGEPLMPDVMGVPAPPQSAGEVTPDVIFAPTLAFDRQGGRLGQGGGYYDRLIASLRANGPLLVIGLAYAGQEVPEVPMEPHDQRLDAILTETDFITVAR